MFWGVGIQDEETASSWEPKTPAPLGGSSPWSFLISRCAAHPTFFFHFLSFFSAGEKKGPSTPQPQQGFQPRKGSPDGRFLSILPLSGRGGFGREDPPLKAPCAPFLSLDLSRMPPEREREREEKAGKCPRGAAPTMSAPSSPSPPAPPPSTRFSRHTMTTTATATSSSASLPAPSPSPPSPPSPSPSLTLGLGLSVTWTSAHSLAYGYHIALLNGVREALVHDVGMSVSPPPLFFSCPHRKERGRDNWPPRLFTAPVTDEATPSPLPLPTFPYLASFASTPPPSFTCAYPITLPFFFPISP